MPRWLRSHTTQFQPRHRKSVQSKFFPCCKCWRESFFLKHANSWSLILQLKITFYINSFTFLTQKDSFWKKKILHSRLFKKCLLCPNDFIPPRKLTWNLKMMVSNRNLLFQGFIFRFHVKFRGCIIFQTFFHKSQHLHQNWTRLLRQQTRSLSSSGGFVSLHWFETSHMGEVSSQMLSSIPPYFPLEVIYIYIYRYIYVYIFFFWWWNPHEAWWW